MPASPRSFAVTDAYRARLLQIAERAEREAVRLWPSPEQPLEGWNERMAQILTSLQREGIRATGGYMAALYATETGRRTQSPTIDSRAYAGLSRDGRPLAEALLSPVIAARKAFSELSVPEALERGLNQAKRTVAFEAMQTPRDALLDAVEADERFTGWQRSVAGTCAACMALSGSAGPKFEVHPSCRCLPLPQVKGAPDRFRLPSGELLFAALSPDQQDEAVGPKAAEAIRAGAPLSAFVVHSPQETQSDFLTQAPVSDAV